ncbi:hypothetical protein GOFOIKOB_6398 [Methylobacterium tardum]|uniref:Uncharacterized protein n=1 Tax=Methylobacterium tardum TaxID=374432 RepID=A0AA37WTZ5_9HYPH|nr:hypothetical protein [Methylobacterium tardum]URD36091.1 hypothetical protein M6G65_27335 [Methylobacterium tardum]GJE53319.1 hypothetical protein GOFOIKOB_6398 [Methylobacterium tardum]GLS73780.1 hypothetical protein GCM10007890_57950 [Methylobacterium tardum]
MAPVPAIWHVIGGPRSKHGRGQQAGPRASARDDGTLQAEKTALAACARVAEGKVARVQASLANVENQLDRFRVMEFWDRVMREIFEFISAGCALLQAEILP